jgi:hypothetical protein
MKIPVCRSNFPDAAAAQINAILDSCEDADGVLADVQQSRGQSERSDESAIDNGTEFPVRPGFVPAASGKTVGKLGMNNRPRGAQDSALASRRRLSARDSVEAAYPDLKKIGR